MTEPRQIGQPEAGYFVLRLVKDGPLVPARIWRPCACTVNGPGDDAIDPNAVHDWREDCDRHPHDLAGEIDGKPADIWRVWTARTRALTAEEIADWHYRTAVQDWAKQHAPDEPEARPWEPVDLSTIAPIF